MMAIDDSAVPGLLGKILVRAETTDQTAEFETDDGTIYHFAHDQDCCEDVWLEDVVGDISDLLGSPLVLAEVAENPPDHPDEPASGHYLDSSSTWTYYRFATAKGPVTLRFCGTSNGYYSESVSVTVTHRRSS